MACKLQPDRSDDLLYVKKGNVHCGYKLEYLAQHLSKNEERLLACKKCSGIIREASFTKGKTTCLVCTENPKKTKPVKFIQDSVGVLEIKCPLLRDCDWEGELSEAETHLKECLFFIIKCKECKKIFPRGNTKKHEYNYCPKRGVYCEYCGKGGKLAEQNEHFQYCSEYPISCPNECGAELPRRELSEHRSECELEVVTCPYTEYGCKAKYMLRRDLPSHKKKFYIEHQDMSLVQMNHFQSEIKQLRDENTEMKWKIKTMKQVDGVEWEIENFDETLGNCEEKIRGPTFYVNNYKLRIYIKYSCFYLRRIEGEFDTNLGPAHITHYRVIQVNTQDYNESHYTEETMDYQLKIGTKSKEIKWREIKWGEYNTYSESECENLLLRFYFEVNSKPLLSLDYYKESPSPPSTPDEDPWDSYHFKPPNVFITFDY